MRVWIMDNIIHWSSGPFPYRFPFSFRAVPFLSGRAGPSKEMKRNAAIIIYAISILINSILYQENQTAGFLITLSIPFPTLPPLARGEGGRREKV